MKPIMIKLKLSNGMCAGRFTCKNSGKKVCNPNPNKKEEYIMCEYYEEKK